MHLPFRSFWRVGVPARRTRGCAWTGGRQVASWRVLSSGDSLGANWGTCRTWSSMRKVSKKDAAMVRSTFLGHGAHAIRWLVWTALQSTSSCASSAHSFSLDHINGFLRRAGRPLLTRGLAPSPQRPGPAGGSFKVLGGLRQAWSAGFAEGSP